MNNSYKHALKQINSIREDLGKFDRGEDVSVGIQGRNRELFSLISKVKAYFSGLL